MSTTITEVAEFTETVTVPQDGDARTAASVVTGFQGVADRTRALRGATQGQFVWSGDFSVAAGGSLTSFSCRVGAIGKLFVADSLGVYRTGSAIESSVTQAKIEGGGGTLGAVARYWYVYAFLTTLGAVDYAISLTGPSSDKRFKSGDATRVYVGCFRTLSTGAPLPAHKVGGCYLYRASALGSNELRAINVSAATGATNQSLAALVPPHARMAKLTLAATGDSNEAALSIYYPGDTAAASARLYAATGFSASAQVDVATDDSQTVDYAVTGSGSPAATVHVAGFYE